MRDRAPERVGVVVAALVVAAGATLVAGGRRAAAADERSAAFQRAVGGLGAGAASSLAPCEAAFDGGVADACSLALDPVPGAAAFCPRHGGPTLRR